MSKLNQEPEVQDRDIKNIKNNINGMETRAQIALR